MYLPADQFAERITPVALWADAVSRGDVLRLIPTDPDGSDAPLPCLVLEVEEARRGKRLLIAPGVTGCADRDRAYEIGLRADPEWLAAGLTGPTRFLGAARIVLRSTSPRVHFPKGAVSPISGRLIGAALDRMNRVRARIHAERDIAAHYALRDAAERAEDARITEVIAARHRRLDA